MDIAALHAFTAVAEHASFSEAAEHLFLTQPAVSKRVRQLEEDLGVALFDRIGRKVSLTEAGRALLPRARRLLNDANEIRRVLSDLAGDVAGQLVMGTSHHIGLHRLPAPLRQFTREHPQVELDIRFMDSEAACHAVEIGDLELAIVTLPPSPLPHLAMQRIWHDPLFNDTATTEIYTLSLHDALPIYLETLQMLVASGLGWSLLPRTQLDERVATVGVSGVALARELGAVTHERRSLSNAATAMIDACRKTA